VSASVSNEPQPEPPDKAEPPERYPGTSFPPSDFSPPHERSAKKGDGTWVKLGDPDLGERAAQGAPVVYRTTVQPHKVSKYVTVTVAAMDLKHTALHLVPGTDDPKVEDLSTDHPPGLVPEAHHDDLVVVMNGGFNPKHGAWGMMARGTVLVPPREEGCTLVMNHDDTVRMGRWPEVADEAQNARAYRQTPPCLLEDGKMHPKLAAGDLRPWGGQAAHRKTRRRSAIGVDATGRVLLFGMGVEAEANLLAEAMKLAGAVHAAQLDINYNWTRFLLFGEKDGTLQVTTTLIPKMVHRKRGYVHHSQPRDFFYLARRH